MRVIRGIHLDRRTFLRGTCASLALPWLDAMRPALARPRAAMPRCLFVFLPNGMNMQEWRPASEGPTAKLTGTLAPLQPLRSRLTVFSGLTIDGGRAHGDGPGDHARAGGSFLTCAHPRKTGGADIHAGVSVDQAIAAKVGGATPFGSLELGLEKGASAGICDSGYSCAYTSNISWRAADTPVAKETQPRAVFARMFGDPRSGDPKARAQQRADDRSVLDLVLADAQSLASRLGTPDRQKLEQYLQSVRELELRLQRLDEERAQQPPVPDGLLDGGSYATKLSLMYELIAMAFATQQTRVATLMVANAGSNRSYRFLGVPEGHHDCSHHGKKPEKLAAVAKINLFHVEQLAVFLRALRAREDGDGDLLHQSLVAFGCGLGDGDWHNHDDLPMLLAGEGGGRAVAQGHMRVPKDTPMANLWLAVMRAMGLDDETFADSTGALALA